MATVASSSIAVDLWVLAHARRVEEVVRRGSGSGLAMLTLASSPLTLELWWLKLRLKELTIF